MRKFKDYAQLSRQMLTIYDRARSERERARVVNAFNNSMYQYAKRDFFRFSNGMTESQARAYRASHGLSRG